MGTISSFGILSPVVEFFPELTWKLMNYLKLSHMSKDIGGWLENTNCETNTKHVLSAAGAQHKGRNRACISWRNLVIYAEGNYSFFFFSCQSKNIIGLIFRFLQCQQSPPLTHLHLTDVIFLISFCISSLLDQKICQLSVLLVALQVKEAF